MIVEPLGCSISIYMMETYPACACNFQIPCCSIANHAQHSCVPLFFEHFLRKSM